MSSDSEVDEFYDAAESTPTRFSRLHADSIVSVESMDTLPPLVDIEEEERKIKEAQRLAEERRRQEDEEMKKQLEKLEEQKQKQREKKLKEEEEAKRKAEENERRRRKLLEMREMMSDEATPHRAPPKPPRTYLESEQRGSLEKLDDSPITPESDTTFSDDTPELTRYHSACDFVIPADESGLADNSDIAEAVADSSREDNDDNVINGSGNLNINCPEQNTEKLQSKHIPAVPEVVVDDLERPESSSDINGVEASGAPKPEPDIVQSVRSREPPPRPVAPPRRKKKPAPIEPLPDVEQLEPCPGPSRSLAVRGLPMEVITPTSTVMGLTRELEQSLDMKSATSGTCIVTAKETDSSKAERTEEETRQERAASDAKPDHEALRACTLPASYREEILANIANEDEKRKSLERVTGGKVPVSQQRPRSNSGSRFLTDKEILDAVMVHNLDTGESIPLSLAEDKLPRCVNPLSLHIMRRTQEYQSDSSLHKGNNSDEEESKDAPKAKTIRAVKATKIKTIRLKKFIGKTVNKVKLGANKGSSTSRHSRRHSRDKVLHGEDTSDEEDDSLEGRRMIKIKASSHHKGPYDFDLLVPVQELPGEHMGAVWTMKFSHCGRLLATGGQDNLLRVWILKSAYAFFEDMRQKYSEASKVSPTPSQDSLSSQSSEACMPPEIVEDEDDHSPFNRRPFCVYKGHTGDLLDLSWSKNYFILSSSMDKTVRLWHVSRKECLCCFQHIDFVTAIAFHPRDDRYFLSGSLDGKLRLWSIPDKKVARWNEVIGQSKLITAANFCVNGKFAVVGTYDGRCVFYSTEQFKYYTQIHVRSTRGKNARGRKVTGIEAMPGEDKILVTSNDSRIRLYDLRDLTLTAKYKGCANNSSQIKASFNANGKYIICGSEDQFVYIWRVSHQFQSARRDRNDFWEGIKAHQAVVTAAIFAPNPSMVIKPQFEYVDSDDKDSPPEVRAEVLVSADFSGAIKVFINKFKPGSG